MSLQGWQETLVTAQGDGTALTAAARASAIPAAAKYTLPANFFSAIGKSLRITAHGRISCAVTTPGTARFDLAFGGNVVADTQAMNLNIVAKTNVPWFLQMILTCRAIGAAANLMQGGFWLSEAGILTALPTVGPGPGGFVVPYNTAPVVGANFDSTASQLVDFFFTQTVATGSLTLHQYVVESLN
jgi:hypothetical protein